MNYSENIARLHPSATIAVSTLAKKLRTEGRDVIDLSAGEPDFDTPARVSEAAVRAIRAGATRYTPAAGLPALRSAVAKEAMAASTAGWRFEPENVVVTNGAKQALFNACFSLFGPGDEVLVAAPYWTSYPEIVTLARAEPVPVRGSESRDFLLTPDDLERAAGPRTRGLIICSPSNPTGAVYEKEALFEVARWARTRGVHLLSDEIYRRISFLGTEGTRAAGLADLPPEEVGPHVIIDGVSKSFAMTGWRIGYSLSDPSLAERMTALQSHTTSNASTPSQMAALEAFSDPAIAAGEIGEMVRAFRRRRDLVVARFRERLPHLPFIEPGGAFYLFVRVDAEFSGEVTGSEAWCARILEETGVAMVPGAAFGDDRFARMSFATSDELLEEAIRRLAERDQSASRS